MIEVMQVKITYMDGRMAVYEVGDVFEHFSESGKPILAMQRVKDGEYGFIDMGIIKAYEILED